MNNSINDLFQRKNRNILSVYFTAGFPDLNSTVPIIQSLIQNGVDMIEIGMPYSDPVADGPIIQQSSAAAIDNGMTIGKLFEQLMTLMPENKEAQSSRVPLVLMGYLNPVMQYGYENFCRDAAAAGVSGLIIPDLPMEEYKRELQPLTRKYNLHFIFLVTPETSAERIRLIDDLSGGFIYAVSSSSVTGRDTDEGSKETYFKRLESYSLKNPLVVGFGIKDHETFSQACKYTNGGIIGTAFVKAISGSQDFEMVTRGFVNMIRGVDM